MKRHQFITILSGLFGLIFSGSFLKDSFGLRNRNLRTQKDVLLYSGYVAGLRYGKIYQVENMIKPGLELDLLPEPDNKYDEYAIRVLVYGRKAGYIPRSENRVIARLINQNIPVKAKVLSHTYPAPINERLIIEVTVDNRVLNG